MTNAGSRHPPAGPPTSPPAVEAVGANGAHVAASLGPPDEPAADPPPADPPPADPPPADPPPADPPPADPPPAPRPARRVASPRLRIVLPVVVVLVVLAPVAALGIWRLMNARSFQLAGEIVRQVETTERVVALTFDDGPVPELVPVLLDLLREEDVRATFFVVGEAAARHPASVRDLWAAGHQLGNHTYSHPRMVFRSAEFYRREVDEADAAIRAAGYVGELPFRPPYGLKLLGLPRYLAATGRTTVMWSVQPEAESGPPRVAEELVRRTVERASPGAIVLLHPWYASGAETRRALREIVRGLRDQGYRFVTVDELLALRR